MESKHTAGNWLHNKDNSITSNSHERILIAQICSANNNEEEAEANARLIAAAPDMLNALIEAKKLLESVRHRMPKSIRNTETFHFENILANVIGKTIHKVTHP
jgi:hypothetical protein